MMEDLFKVDHEKAKGGEFEPIAPGEYEVIVSEAEVTKSKSSGADMIKLTLTIRDDFDQPFKKRKVWDYLVFVPQNAWKIQQVYKAFGFTNGQTFSNVQEVAKALLYQPVVIRVKHEKYQDKITERVDYYKETRLPKPQYGAPAHDPFADPFANAGTPVNIDDSTLPF